MYPDELCSTLWYIEIKKKLIDAYTSIYAFTTQFGSRIQVYVTCLLENSEKKKTSESRRGY